MLLIIFFHSVSFFIKSIFFPKPNLVSETITENKINPAPIIALVVNISWKIKKDKTAPNNDSVQSNIEALAGVVYCWQVVCNKKQIPVENIPKYNADKNCVCVR